MAHNNGLYLQNTIEIRETCDIRSRKKKLCLNKIWLSMLFLEIQISNSGNPSNRFLFFVFRYDYSQHKLFSPAQPVLSVQTEIKAEYRVMQKITLAFFLWLDYSSLITR